MKKNSSLFQLSQYLFSWVLLFGLGSTTACNTNKANPTSEVLPSASNKSTIETNLESHTSSKSSALETQEKLHDKFSQEYTKSNNINGRWKIDSISSDRGDSSMEFFKSLIQEGTTANLLIQDSAGDISGTLEIITPDEPDQISCKLTIPFGATYCCFKMLQLTLIFQNSDPVKEAPSGCIQNRYKIPLKNFSDHLINALTKTMDDPAIILYHFNHNSNQTRIRLQTPVPTDKFHPVPSEQTIYLTQVLE